MVPEEPYVPIDCSLHDRYLAWATLRKEISITFMDHGTQQVTQGRIIDVFTDHDRTEWLKMTNGERIRLDRIVSVTEQP